MDQATAVAGHTRVLVADDDRTTRYALAAVLRNAQHNVVEVENGADALKQIEQGGFDLVFLDVWMPGMSGLDVLAGLRRIPHQPKVIVMTTDDAPDTLLKAVREQAYEYVSKPFSPTQAVEMAARAMADATTPIQVICAQPQWVELLIPCTRDAAERVHGFLARLDANLAPETRHSIGMAFRELVLNAVEWGGKLDPNRQVRIAYVRFEKMLMYRIADPGSGFDPAKLPHAAIGHSTDDPTAHVMIRDDLGIRPGGFGIMMTRAYADELIYNEKRNEVIFVKYLESAAQ